MLTSPLYCAAERLNNRPSTRISFSAALLTTRRLKCRRCVRLLPAVCLLGCAARRSKSTPHRSADQRRKVPSEPYSLIMSTWTPCLQNGDAADFRILVAIFRRHPAAVARNQTLYAQQPSCGTGNSKSKGLKPRPP